MPAKRSKEVEVVRLVVLEETTRVSGPNQKVV
jgi:hypothetical protein